MLRSVFFLFCFGSFSFAFRFSFLNLEYQEETNIDGLPVDLWANTVEWEDTKTLFYLDYYFTTEDFKPRDTLTPNQIPVRIEVLGVTTSSGTETEIFHQVYEVLDFRVFSELPLETFSLPEYMTCTGAKSAVWNIDFPHIPPSMAYTVERVSHNVGGKTTVELASVYLDSERRLLRVDQAGSTSISDFSTGLEHYIDDKGCGTRAIIPDNVPSAGSANGVIYLSDRTEVSYLKNDYSYIGYKKFRGILTHAFSSKKGSELITAYVSMNSMTPLGLKIYETGTGLTTHFNIFEFTDLLQYSKEYPFGIEQCRKPALDRDVMIAFSIQGYGQDFQHELELDPKITTDELRNNLAGLIPCSPLQIITRDIVVVEQNLYWLITLLHEYADNKVAKVENNVAAQSASDLSEAVVNLVFEGRFVYTSNIWYWDGIELFAVSVHSGAELLYLSIHSDITYTYEMEFGKCVEKFEDDAELLARSSIHECGQECSDRRSVSCTSFEYVPSSMSCYLSWSEKFPKLIESSGCSVYRRHYKSYFAKEEGFVLQKRDDVTYKKTDHLEGCAKLCMEEKTFHCESFDYCYDESRCQLYDTHFYSKDASPISGQESVLCSHFSRLLRDYDTSYQKDFVSEYAVEVQTKSYEECSYLCSKDEDGCTAFTYCDPSGTCKMLPSSQADTATFTTVNANCTLAVARGIINTADGAGAVSETFKSSSGSTYSGGAMFGLAVAMLAVGAGSAGLAYFLLQHFNIWKGF